MKCEHHLKRVIGIILVIISSFSIAFVTPIRIETTGTFVVVHKQDGLITANMTDVSFWVYTNETTVDGYFSEWLEINKTINLPMSFFEQIQVNHVYQLTSKYNIFNMLCGQTLSEWY